jgi:Flp pilus assembly pilin Flp
MIKHTVFEFWHEEEGQDMVEYALLLAFVALAAVAVLGTVKTQISSIWTKVSSSLSTAAS